VLQVYEEYDKHNGGSHVTQAPGLIDTGHVPPAHDDGVLGDEDEDGQDGGADSDNEQHIYDELKATGENDPFWGEAQAATPVGKAPSDKLEPKKSSSKSAADSRYLGLQDAISKSIDANQKYRQDRDREQDKAQVQREVRQAEYRREREAAVERAAERDAVRQHELAMMLAGGFNAVKEILKELVSDKK